LEPNDKIYYKGKFVGIFKLKDRDQVDRHIFSKIKWCYIKIDHCKLIHGDFDPENFKVGDFLFESKITNKKGKFSFNSLKTEILIKPDQNDDSFYSGNLYNVIFRDIKLSRDKNYFLDLDWHEASGTIFFQIDNPPIIEIKNEALQPSKPAAKTDGNLVSEAVDIKNQDSEQIVDISKAAHPLPDQTNQIQSSLDPFTGSSSNPITSSLPYYSSEAFNINRTINLFKWIGRFVLLLFLIPILYYLFFYNKFLFIVFSFLTIAWLVSRILVYRIFKIIAGLLFLAGVLIFFLSLFVGNSEKTTPLVKKDGNIEILPPIKIGGSGQLESQKRVNWYDFFTNHYLAHYNTNFSSFDSSTVHQEIISEKIKQATNDPNEYFRYLYNGLYTFDEQKVKHIVKIFKDSSERKHLNTLQTVEMVTTFIQEIPYYLVHENSCQYAVQQAIRSGDNFTVEYHREHKPCLPNVPGGVQSPYEFLHNLKGDCDTRSLLGYTILKELGISCSVWVSQSYGHSILGVGVPVGNGIYKYVNGIKHYGVELTAKGYRLGMVSPQTNNPFNWDISIFYNN